MANNWFIFLILLNVTVYPILSIDHQCENSQEHCLLVEKQTENESDPNMVANMVPDMHILKLSENKVNMSDKWAYWETINKSAFLNTDSFIDYAISKVLNKSNAFDAINNNFENSVNEKEIISRISKKILSFSTPFDASQSSNASQECRDHMQIYLKSLQNFDLWALQMHDSSARLASGILNGNINQFGDYDQCLNVQIPMKNVQGQYCLAYMQASVSHKTPYLKKIHNLIQSHSAFKSEFNDPGHRVPRFSLINWALCVPSTCSAIDVENSLKAYISNLTSDLLDSLEFQIRVEPTMCQVNDREKSLDRNTKLACGFFLFILTVCLISTAYDYSTVQGNQNEWLVTFSLSKNTKWLFSTTSGPGDIQSVHGIRFFNALMLLLSHKSMAIFFNPYTNRTYMAQMLGQPWTVLGRAASIYTDPFLLFSGMLTAYSLFGRLQRNQSVKLRSEYIGRLLRIVPTLGALILFCTYVLPMLGSGPQWNLVVRHHSDICKKHWWRNLLFIHNYFGFSNMCLTHTHHLGIDTELFAFAPILILALWKWPKKGVIFLLTIASISTAARFHTTVANRLSNYVYFGTTIRRLFKTADYMYSFPPHRATVYILGILLGYALRTCKDIKLTTNQLRWGWLISATFFLAAFLGPAPMGDINYKYNPIHAACYAAFAPIAWCGFFAWIVFVSHLGYKNRLTDFLSWKGFQITTKLSYAIYLTQFPVFFYNVGRRRSADYYSFVPIMVDTNEYFCIFAASVILTLMFDSPFQNIKKIMFRTSTPVQKNLAQIKSTTSCSENYVKNVLD